MMFNRRSTVARANAGSRPNQQQVDQQQDMPTGDSLERARWRADYNDAIEEGQPAQQRASVSPDYASTLADYQSAASSSATTSLYQQALCGLTGGGGGGSTLPGSDSSTLTLFDGPPSMVKILDIQRHHNRRSARAKTRPDADEDQAAAASPVDDKTAGDKWEAAESGNSHQHQNRNSLPGTSNQANEPPGPQNQQQQPGRQQKQQQQKQQSGETLSSFESDYDLLVYLGETETEDIVDTERSLDYQDQTWRQSICGGASLAPTIDESLSDLIGSSPFNNFDLINTPQPQSQAPSFQQQRPQLTPSPIYSARTSQQQHQSTLPRAPRQSNNEQRQAEIFDELDNEVSLAFSRGRLHQPASSAQTRRIGQQQFTASQQPQQRKRLAGEETQLKSRTLSSANRPTRQADFQSAREMHRGRPQRPAAFDSAAELDRLLAEMNQSLDLDSLARFDSAKSNVNLGSQQHQPAYRPIDPNATSQTLSKFHRLPASEVSTTDKTRNQPKSQINNQFQLKHQQQQQLEKPKSAANMKDKSILDEYDGASRMLEQMLSGSGQDLIGSLNGSSQGMSKSQGSLATTTNNPNNIYNYKSRKDSTPDSIQRSREAAQPDRKMSTCSSSVATEVSVVPAFKRDPHPQPVQPPPINKLPAKPVPIWAHHRPIQKQQSIDVPAVPPKAPTVQLQLQSDRLMATGRPEEANKLSASDDDSLNNNSASIAPPPPPAKDYQENNNTDDEGVIEVRAHEMPSSNFSDSDDMGAKKEGSQMARMKRRTLSSMRSMRDKFNDFMKPSEHQQAMRKQSQPSEVGRAMQPPKAPPRPPKRSSSIGSSRSQRSSDNNRDIEQERSRGERSSRQRSRHRKRTDEPHQSFGQQLRERLSRSKSRFVDRFFGAGANKHRARSQPNVGRLDNDDRKRAGEELFQPSDIARNSEPAEKSTTLLATEKRDSFEESLDRHLAASLDAEAQKKLQTSPSQSSLSGLEEVKSSEVRQSRKLIRKNSQKSNKNHDRSSSLSSMKKLREISSNKSPVEDLDSIKVSTTKEILTINGKPVKEITREFINLIPGDRPLDSDEYFSVNRNEAESSSRKRPPNRSQSMRSIQRVANGPDMDRSHADKKRKEPDRTVSFTNLNTRQFRVPTSTITFRPISALANYEDSKGDEATRSGELVAEPNSQRERPKSSLAVTQMEDASRLTPVGFSANPLAVNTEKPKQFDHQDHHSPTSIRERMGGLKSRLFSVSPSLSNKRRNDEPQSLSPAPTRPPRRRTKSASGARGEDDDEEPGVIDVEAATPNSSLTLERDDRLEEVPRPAIKTGGNQNKLSAFAQQLKHSAVDFLKADSFRKSMRSSAAKPPVKLVISKPTILVNPVEKQRPGPLEWRPVIQVPAKEQSGKDDDELSKVAAIATDADAKEKRRLGTLPAASGAGGKRQSTLDTDSTWETSDSELNDGEDADESDFKPGQGGAGGRAALAASGAGDKAATCCAATTAVEPNSIELQELEESGSRHERAREPDTGSKPKLELDNKQRSLAFQRQQVVVATTATTTVTAKVGSQPTAPTTINANQQRNEITIKQQQSQRNARNGMKNLQEVNVEPNREAARFQNSSGGDCLHRDTRPADDNAELQNICKTSFKFNSNLPDPEQFLAKRVDESEPREMMKVTHSQAIEAPNQQKQQQQQEESQKRRSVYDNVVDPAAPSEPSSGRLSWRKPPTPPRKPVIKPTHLAASLSKYSQADNDSGANGTLAEANGQEESWSLEAIDSRQLPLSSNSAKVLESRLKIQQQQPLEAIIGSDIAAEQPTGADEATNAQQKEIPKRKLITMTSIIQDPNDELMMVAKPTIQRRGSLSQQSTGSGNLQERDDQSDNSNADDSSLASLVKSRQRLMNKFEEVSGDHNKSNQPQPQQQAINSTQASDNKLPITRNASTSSSLVKRLAKNFDLNAQEQQQPSRLGKTASFTKSPVITRKTESIELINNDLSQASNSTWFDANQDDQVNVDVALDEAEVAEFLRDFDKGPAIAEVPSSPGQQDTSVSTGMDPFVTVADSTIEEDLAAKRSENVGSNQNNNHSNEDDNTLNEADDTLADEDDLMTLEQQEQQQDENSSNVVELSAAEDDFEDSSYRSATNDNNSEIESKAARAARPATSEQSCRASCELLSSGDSSRVAAADADSCKLIQMIGGARSVTAATATATTTTTKLEIKIKPPAAAAKPASSLNTNRAYGGEDDNDDKGASVSRNANNNNDNNRTSSGRGDKDANPTNTTAQIKQAKLTTTSPTTSSSDGHNLLIDKQFKNSLNQLIANNQSSQAAAQTGLANRDSGGDSKMFKLPANCKLRQHFAGQRAKREQHDKSGSKVKAKGQTSAGGIKTKELKGLSKYCKALLRHTTHKRAAKKGTGVPIPDYVHSSSSSANSSGASSTASSSLNSPVTSDDEKDESSERQIVKAAKKCSQLYEELEKILAHRAAKKDRLKRQQEAESSSPFEQQQQPAERQRVAEFEEEEEEEEEDDDDESDDELDSVSKDNDLVSLSSSSFSSEFIPEIKQRQNLQKLYHVVNEICSSELKFVGTLKLLNEDFRQFINAQSKSSSAGSKSSLTNNNHNSYSNIPPECLSTILKHLPQLQALNENLLDELQRAKELWPKTQKIAHVLVKIGPFLKHYSTYIREFEFMSAQFQENLKKYPHFHDKVKEFEQQEKCGKLIIQHHLLKPIQRIPQYRLLLQQYLHYLKPDDVDYEDTVLALEVVSRVAEHANQSMQDGANFAKLLALQAKIVAGRKQLKSKNIVQPGRQLIKEGELMKICRKQIQPRWFVLLNDSLLYLTQIQSSDILYLNNELPLDDCLVSIPSEEQAEQEPEEQREAKQFHANEFTVCTKERSFALIAKTTAERDDWVSTLRHTVEEHMARRRSFSIKQRQALQQQQQQQRLVDIDDGSSAEVAELEPEEANPTTTKPANLLGHRAPLWTPDSRATMCQLCTSSFSALFRRHHCRACGRVVCSACSSNKAPLIYLKCRSARVCDECFDILKANIHTLYNRLKVLLS